LVSAVLEHKSNLNAASFLCEIIDDKEETEQSNVSPSHEKDRRRKKSDKKKESAGLSTNALLKLD
jgi:hypothetical protein